MEILRGPSSWPSVLLARAGRYDPDAGLPEAEAVGAWSVWRRAVASMSPASVIRVVAESGLRGRGGAGYPTGAKWRACAEAPADVRYVVANGYEADPGALVDRTLMEIDPHAVVEGLALAAFAVGAREARLAVKADYRLAIRRLRTVIRTAEEQGYLGSNAMNAGFDLHITVHPVQGAFVLGEETALLRALENKRLQPDQRPPYPTAVGLWGRPTVVNNVETLAAVPAIVDYGGAAYRGLGVADAPGTTLVQVSGAVRRPGVAEVPLGTTLREALQVAGGGRGRIKAALMGGPSGGFLPPASLDTPILYGPLTEAGAIMGSGTLLFADESACIVDLVNLMQRYLSDEACGKTIPCRIGTRRLCEITDRFVTGRPRPTDPQLLLDLASDVRDGALCQLEYTAPNPLLSGVRYFGQEFEDHILRSTCSAGVCRPLRVAAATS